MNVYIKSQCVCKIVLILLFKKTSVPFDMQSDLVNLVAIQCYKKILSKVVT